MASKGGSAAHCPTSNMFLGSGLFDLRRLRDASIRVGLGTDVGGGTSLSLLKTMREAYKVMHLQQQPLPPGRAMYLATLGAAEALYLDDCIGNFVAGKDADFVVLDPTGTAISAHRTSMTSSISELLFALIVLGDDRNIAATYLQGRRA
jgi:guanine deaminase